MSGHLLVAFALGAVFGFTVAMRARGARSLGAFSAEVPTALRGCTVGLMPAPFDEGYVERR